MKSFKKAIAVAPEAPCLCLAAACHKFWNSFHAAGEELVEEVLAEWAADDALREGLLLVPRIGNPARVKRLLSRIDEQGGKLIWLAVEGGGVAQACEGFERVDVVEGPSVEEAFVERFGKNAQLEKLLAALHGPDPSLRELLRYKTAVFMMGDGDSEPLKEALETVARAVDSGFNVRVLRREDALAIQRFRKYDFAYLEGFSAPLRALKSRIRAVARHELGVLVLGETGTDRESVAFFLHELGRRRSKRLTSLNCAGLQPKLLRAELFGYEKGAFTGAHSRSRGLLELSEGGTVFVDDIGAMPLDVQASLLGYLETGRYRRVGGGELHEADVRIIVGAQPNLHGQVQAGEFRRDLFYRVAEVEVPVPALRDLPADLLRIVQHIVRDNIGRLDDPTRVEATIAYFDAQVAALTSYNWPGNVDELRALVKRRLFLGDDVVSDLARATPPSKMRVEAGRPAIPLPDAPDAIRPLDHVVNAYVRHAYENRGSLTQAQIAQRLGRAVNTVKRILRETGTGA